MNKKMIIKMLTLTGILLLPGCQQKSGRVRQFLHQAEKTNRNCPVRLNETVTLDSTRYDETQNAVYYYYTASGELDNPTYMQDHQASFLQALKEAVINSAELKDYRDYGTRFHYVYFSAGNRKQLATFSFTADEH